MHRLRVRVTNFAGVARYCSLLLHIPNVAGPCDHARGVLSASITDDGTLVARRARACAFGDVKGVFAPTPYEMLRAQIDRTPSP